MFHGKRVSLRRVEPDDYPLIQAWQNDPEIFRWMDYEHPFTLDDIRQSEEQAIEEGHPFIIEVAGKPIGRIGLNNIRARERMASMYIFIGDREEWGKGHALDAILVLLRFGFDNLNVRAVELWTLGDNERAIKLYKNAGFVEDARLPERSYRDGRYIDHVVMRVDREGYARARDAHGL